jgi:hypothetical protein
MNSIGSKTTTQPSQQGNAAALAARDINHIPPIAGEDAVAKSNARQSASRQGSNRTVPQQVMGPWREMNRFPPTPSTATVTKRRVNSSPHHHTNPRNHASVQKWPRSSQVPPRRDQCPNASWKEAMISCHYRRTAASSWMEIVCFLAFVRSRTLTISIVAQSCQDAIESPPCSPFYVISTTDGRQSYEKRSLKQKDRPSLSTRPPVSSWQPQNTTFARIAAKAS